MGKEFDKQAFQKTNNKIGIFCILIGIIAIASIICAFAVGAGIMSFGKISAGKGSDPKDYYGEYYSYYEGKFITVSIDASECSLTTSNGLKGNVIEVERYKYDYVSPQYVQQKFPNESRKDCPAILAYTDSSKQSAIIFWVTSSNPYQFVIQSKNITVTPQKYDFEKQMGDPKNYYGTFYCYDTEHFVTLNRDGTAALQWNETRGNYLYSYVNSEWIKANLGKKLSAAIVLYKEGDNTCQTFEYISGTELSFNGNPFSINGLNEDPEDYYGEYYSSSGITQYTTYRFEASGCTVTISNGLRNGSTSAATYPYEYIAAKYVQSKGLVPSYAYQGCAAIIVYTDVSTDSGFVLWVVSNSPYRFALKDGSAVTKEKVDFAEEMGDPKNYYATYSYDATHYVTLKSDGTAYLCWGNTKKNLVYSYVSKDWLRLMGVSNNANPLILLYEAGNSSSYYDLEYISSTKLKFSGYALTRK